MKVKYQKNILIFLTSLFFIGAIWGLKHGLPFHLVGDEESIIGGTLQFLNERTIFPILNPQAFKLLYYPIAIPYSILVLFLPYALGVLLFNPLVTNFVELGHYTLVNLDHIWLLARSVSLLAGIAAVYVTYKLAQAVFPKNQYVGFFAALFILTSLYHFQLSVVMRHWMFSTVFFTAALYFLFKSQFTLRRDALWAGLLAALASGFGQLGLVTVFFIGFSYIILSRKKPWYGLKNKNIWLFIFIAISGFAFFVATHPGGFVDVAEGVEISTLGLKPLGYYLNEFKQTALHLLNNDAVVTILGLLGALVMGIKKKRWTALIFVGIIILYNVLLLTFFHNAARYHWYIIPLLAVMGAYLLSLFWSYVQQTRIKRILGAMLIAVVYIVPTVLLVQYGKLLTRSTTEQAAFTWLSERVTGEVILINSRSISPLQQDEYVGIQDGYGRSLNRNRLLVGVDVTVYGKQKYAFTNTHYWDDANQSASKVREFVDDYNPVYVLLSFDSQQEYDNLMQWYVDLNEYTLVYQTSLPESESARTAFSNFGLLNKDLLTITQLGQHIRIYKQ